MNIHTVEISRPLGPDLIRLFCRTQKCFQFPGMFQQNSRWTDISDFIISSSNIDRSKDLLRSNMYPAAGIQQVKLLHNPSKQGYFYLVVIVNLESLYQRDMTVESFHCNKERLQSCCNAFETIMGNLSGLPSKSLLEWSARRVDYTVDQRYPGLAPLYIALAKRGRIPYGFVEERQYEGSYYLKSRSDDVRINFYDKEAQLRNDHFLNNNDRLIEQAHGLVRFEVQCMDEKLKRICKRIKRRGLPYYDMRLRTFLNADVANAVVQEYYSMAIGYHDYFTLQAAEQHIYENRGRKDMKERIMRFLRQVDRAVSVSAAIQAYNTGKMPDMSQALITGPESSLQNLLNVYLPRLGINPVTLPTEAAISRLSNPMPENLRI